MNNPINYRACFLYSIASKNAGMSKETQNCLLEKFDYLSAQFGAEAAFGTLCEAYSPQTVEKTLSSYASAINISPILSKTAHVIQENLSQIALKKIETNPVLRIKNVVERFNKNVSRCSMTLSDARHQNVEILSPEEKENLMMRTEQSKAQKVCQMESWASFKNGRHNLENIGG